MADSDNDSGEKSGGNNNRDRDFSSPREQDRFLPIANVSRIMKKALPANAKISKDAKETVQECVSEFISFITGEASDKCQREKRKTINGDDLVWAMTTLGFEDYVEPLKIYLQRFRELEGERTGTPFHGNNNINNNGVNSGTSGGVYGNNNNINGNNNGMLMMGHVIGQGGTNMYGAHGGSMYGVGGPGGANGGAR